MGEHRGPLTRRGLLGLLGAGALALLTGCSGADETGPGAGADTVTSEGTEMDMTKIKLTVNGTDFAATLADTDAARELAGMLPMTLQMDELNGNEKYAYLDETLPADASCPGSIEAGDLMLFGSDCLVLFYQGFSTGYRYTRLGRIDDPTGLAEACGRGAATVTWGLA